MALFCFLLCYNCLFWLCFFLWFWNVSTHTYLVSPIQMLAVSVLAHMLKALHALVFCFSMGFCLSHSHYCHFGSLNYCLSCGLCCAFLRCQFLLFYLCLVQSHGSRHSLAFLFGFGTSTKLLHHSAVLYMPIYV